MESDDEELSRLWSELAKKPITRIFDKKTYVPERKVTVSTVGYNRLMGAHRTAETTVFAASDDGEVVDWAALYIEGHGMYPSGERLEVEHMRVVAGIRDGSIALDNFI